MHNIVANHESAKPLADSHRSQQKEGRKSMGTKIRSLCMVPLIFVSQGALAACPPDCDNGSHFVSVSLTQASFRDFLDIFRGNGATIGLNSGVVVNNQLSVTGTLFLNNAGNFNQDTNFSVSSAVTAQVYLHQNLWTAVTATTDLYGGTGVHLNDVSLSVTATGTASDLPISSRFVSMYDFENGEFGVSASGDIRLDPNATFRVGLPDLLSSPVRLTYRLDTAYSNGEIGISGNQRYDNGDVQFDYTGRLSGPSVGTLLDLFHIELPDPIEERLGQEDINLHDFAPAFEFRGIYDPQNFTDRSYHVGFTFVPVPEPPAFVLFGTATLLLMIFAGRRKLDGDNHRRRVDVASQC
jgi:hypothetical protein